MRMKITLSILLIAAVSSLSAQTSTSPGRRLLTEKDLFEFVWVADPELSPDGTQVAFTRVNCDEKRTGYETSIWLAPTNGKQAPMRMTNGKHDAQPRWSPDGKFLVFVRGGEKDEAYLDLKRHSHLWVLGLGDPGQEPGKPVQITSGNYDEGDLVWSKDASRIYFLTRRVDEPYYELPATDIYSVPSGGGDSEKLATIPMYVGNLTLSPDGRQFAFHGSVSQPVRSYSQPDLWVMDAVKDAKPRKLTGDYDFDMGSSVLGDNAVPSGRRDSSLSCHCYLHALVADA